MEGCQVSKKYGTRTSRNSWNRDEAAERLQRAERIQNVESQRRAAAGVDVPRSTLRGWQNRKAELELPENAATFFESPEGVAFLYRMLAALHVVFSGVGPCGPRLISKFLQLIDLSDLIGTSYGAQFDYGTEVREALAEFGKEESARLAEQMSPREITVCEDETFHPQICLVAIEPLSDFILLEQYASNREAETWSEQLDAATAGFPIKIVQSTSDEGRSLVKHCRTGLGAHHSPDVFHVQQDVSRAFSGKTNGTVSRQKTKLREAKRETARLRSERQAIGPTHEVFFDNQIELAEGEEQQAARDIEKAKRERQVVRDAVRGISDVYHPVDLMETGEPRTSEEVQAALAEKFDQAERLADTWEVSQSRRKLITKARKVVPRMVATIAFFWSMVRFKMDALQLSSETTRQLTETLVPAVYMEQASRRASKAEERKRLRETAAILLTKARDGPLRNLSDEKREEVERVGRDCAGLFQRSSSCVEGRNGRLALHHHGLHRLSTKKLAALTTLHNYFIERADHTTAAERFFGSPPRDLFQWLLERLPLPPRPRRRGTSPGLEA
jgi:cell division protein FtsL